MSVFGIPCSDSSVEFKLLRNRTSLSVRQPMLKQEGLSWNPARPLYLPMYFADVDQVIDEIGTHIRGGRRARCMHGSQDEDCWVEVDDTQDARAYVYRQSGNLKLPAT